MKKGLSIILLMLMLLSLVVGCAEKGGENEETYTIGFTVNDFNDLWVTYILDAVRAWDEEHPEVEVVLGNSESDVSKQMAIVEDWITQGFDAICVKPVELEATIAMAEKCNEAGIPYVAVQQPIDEADVRISQNSVKTGEDQMQAVIDMLGGKGKVAIMWGEPGTLVCTQRIDGNKNILAKYPDVEMVAEEVGNWQRDQGMAIMENWLQAGLEVDAIVCCNDEMALGAILALEAAGVRDQYIVAGIDATPEALEFMKDGRLDLTLYADAETLARKSLEAAMKLITEGHAEDEMIDDILVLPEDVDKYINK